MPFGYSNDIFSHPAVEYIPLLPVANQTSVKNIHNEKPQLAIFTNQQEFESFSLSDQGQPLPLNSNKEMGIALINSRLEFIKYRGNYVTIMANPSPGHHQVVKVLTRYFYKSNLIFQLLDSSGKVHSQKKLTIPIKR